MDTVIDGMMTVESETTDSAIAALLDKLRIVGQEWAPFDEFFSHPVKGESTIRINIRITILSAFDSYTPLILHYPKKMYLFFCKFI